MDSKELLLVNIHRQKDHMVNNGIPVNPLPLLVPFYPFSGLAPIVIPALRDLTC